MTPADRLLIASVLFGVCFAVLLAGAAVLWRRRRRRRRRSGMQNYFQD